MPEPDEPLVSIITPTIPGREHLLIHRCMPSVLRQNWPGPLELVIISDENASLRRVVAAQQRHMETNFGDDPLRTIRFIEINDTWKRPDVGLIGNGATPWMIGSRLALGEFMSFLGDDDELLPHHVSLHIRTMQAAQAMWSLSKVEFRAHNVLEQIIGDESYAEAHLDATGIMCWKGALRAATWDPDANTAAPDWKLVDDWRTLGLPGAFINDVTGIHHDGWLIGLTGKPYPTP
jgi:hypothetical protein